MYLLRGEGTVIKAIIGLVLLMIVVSVVLTVRQVGQSTKNPNAPLLCDNSTAVPSIELGSVCR